MGIHNKKGQPSTSVNSAEVGSKAFTVAMFSKEFQKWNSLTTHMTNNIWCTEFRLAVTLAFFMPLVWASWFQFFALVLSLVKLNSTSSQVLLHDPHVLITAMCCATRLTIAAQPTVEALLTVAVAAQLAVGAKLTLVSVLLPHVLEVNKVETGVIIACMPFKIIILQI